MKMQSGELLGKLIIRHSIIMMRVYFTTDIKVREAMTSKTRTPANIHLFVRPSFWRGVARVVDPMGTINEYNTTSSEKLADFRALYSDWKAVGDDIKRSIREYDRMASNP